MQTAVAIRLEYLILFGGVVWDNPFSRRETGCAYCVPPISSFFLQDLATSVSKSSYFFSVGDNPFSRRGEPGGAHGSLPWVRLLSTGTLGVARPNLRLPGAWPPGLDL